ncbi:aldehyde dehydrogenase (NADP(+)) [Kerstersia gyiorum]|uniref:aldehyde dehydrogenase (NADP(+)) n=1 Tax=Kerstersia gyiorum TaxID=206506 RepID=UPI0020A0BD20|nr:aldehyde dehydrogenase (NADP(+)) [Kerstersia gyiorum]MCP1678251.1 NADP-dependent aldehyde dehydrogenase [Kerstersia gyiorum]MCP1821858.1 NADP-dependent aldehyde dehydrogenase [Kerstersia gyiorum]MCP1825282.1 NADP-dependent aldehyde dehydrogenase [Kerstersia gyiorum]MCW2449158.1 NADP-dependent aldehyde dehydrogenase [Kerstersia gyiorum]
MTFTPHGKHLIAGEWVATTDAFQSSPAHGPSYRFSTGSPELVDRACQAAEAAFPAYAASSRQDRAALLEAIADEIEARGADITAIGSQETGLPEARLNGERGRTTGQLRLFARHILKGEYLDRRLDEAQPERQPQARPEIRMMQRPVGPVAVFGASNFPLAFSVAGGDTAAALAAGCPVVVKGHPAHPGTGEIVAQAILAAIQRTNMPPGIFSLIQDGGPATGAALVQHPLILAVGFTGSQAGGRALFDLCAQRPEPIPFFGELGSVNPMFILPAALHARGAELAQGWAASLTLGAGQFCTNPGIAIVSTGPQGDAFVNTTASALANIGPQTMLTSGIADAYCHGKQRFEQHPAVREVYVSGSSGRSASPNLYEVCAQDFLAAPTLAHEVFGPLGLVVRASNDQDMTRLARQLEGQLTATLQMDDDDTALAHALLPILERKAGRILVNGFPTGVEVVDSMVHGGPYPASTNFGATSVGTLSIRRFLRPVAYQNLPGALMPDDLRQF